MTSRRTRVAGPSDGTSRERFLDHATKRGRAWVILLDVTLRAEALSPDHIAHAFVAQRERDFFASVRTEPQAERERGRLRDGLDLDLVARLITSQIEGIQLAWLADSSVDMAAHLQTLMHLIRKS